MNTYMIDIKLPAEMTEEFLALIPKQRTCVDKLMDDGKILQYSLSYNRTQLWVIMVASSKKNAKEILSTFPLIHLMQPTIIELAFHNSISNDLPKLIMN